MKIAIITVVALFSVTGFSLFQQKTNRIEYSKTAVFPRLTGQNLGIYEQTPDFQMTSVEGQESLKLLLRVAESKIKFRLNPAMKTATETWFNSSEDPSASASFNTKNGDISFNGGMANFLGNESTTELLKNQTALQRAQSYINEMNLPIKANELVVGHIGGVNKGIHEGSRTTVFEKFTTVRFDRQLDKIPVFGHSRLVFQMAEKGKLQSFLKQWTPLDKLPVAPIELLQSTEEMRQQVEKAILEENQLASKIRVESIRLVYYDNATGRVEPALHLEGKTIHREQDKIQEFPYDVVIPLLKSPRLRYTFQHNSSAKQPNAPDKTDEKEQISPSEDDKDKIKVQLEGKNQKRNGATLEQNVPNPVRNETKIVYFIPEKAQSAQITLYNNLGVAIKTVDIQHFGNGTIELLLNELPVGTYHYVLWVDGKKIATKTMMLH